MGKDLLLVEDNADHQAIISAYLRAEGHRVFVADNGLIALEILKDRTIDLIILDMWLPSLDGLSVLKSLKARAEWSAIPVIVATAIGRQKDVPQLEGFGISGFFTKPYEPVEMVAAVQKVLN